MWSGAFDFGKLGEALGEGLQKAKEAAESQLGEALAIAKAEAESAKALLSGEEPSAGEPDEIGCSGPRE